MKRYLLLTSLLLPIVGCAPAKQDITGFSLPYQPGRKFLLTYSNEMVTSGTEGVGSYAYISSRNGKTTETTEWREIEKKTTKCSSTQKDEREMPLLVRAGKRPGEVAIAMTIRRYRSRQDSSGTVGGEKYEVHEAIDTTKPGPDKKEKDRKELIAYIKSLSYSFVMDKSGRIIDFDAKGKGIKKLNEKDPASKHWKKRWNIIPNLFGGTGCFLHYGGCFNALEEAVAYLPKQRVSVGQKWKVTRNEIWPYHAYAFYMLTQGGAYASENATCRLHAIRQTAGGRIAVIRMTGRRKPISMPEENCELRVDYLKTTGEILLNLKTGCVVSQRIESVPHFIKSEDKWPGKIKLIDTLTLKPLDK